jgi:hypothetical protein
MTHFFGRASRLALVCLILGGCGPLRSASSSPSESDARGDWRTVSTQASQEVQAGRYSAADRLLADFAARHGGTSAAADAAYRRALYRADPANPNASAKEAMAILDSNLATSPQGPRRTDAAALRRLVAALDARPAVVTVNTPSSAPSSAPSRAEEKARDEELAKMKDELAKANAELERIKRRLATPKP